MDQEQNLKTFNSDEELTSAISESWTRDNNEDSTPIEKIALVIGGKAISQGITEVPGTDTFIIYRGIIKDPAYLVTNEQMCSILDEGNHCLSKGSIFYEKNFAIVQWSNLGHI